MSHLLGGVEGGGTKYVCAVGDGVQTISDEIRFPTTTPAETISRAIAFFKKHDPVAIGIAHFGPMNLDKTSPLFGSLTHSPKADWSDVELLTTFRRAFQVPITLDLDANAAAFGEYILVANNRFLDSLVYFTIGTGIGAGFILNGQVVHGLSHPEAGHVRLPHDQVRDPFTGSCPFHGDCFEGLASGTAISARWKQSGETLPDNHPAWDLETDYIAAALVNVIFSFSPQRIILGGGVMDRKFLFPLIRQKVVGLLNGYLTLPIFSGPLDQFIIPPALGNRSGVLGALAMAKVLIEEKK